MKNKRTKLTALLLSALMAVSTITSVTWAADLFSDGNEVVEATVAEAVENNVAEENDTLSAGTETSVVYDAEGVVKSGSRYYLTYRIDVTNPDGTVIQGTPKEIEVTATGTVDYENCKHPRRIECSFKLPGEEQIRYAWFVQTDGWVPGEHTGESKTFDILKEATCTQIGLALTYVECSGCGLIENTSTGVYENVDISVAYDALKAKLPSIAQGEELATYKARISQTVQNSGYFKLTDLSELGHAFGAETKTVIPGKDSEDYNAALKDPNYGKPDEFTYWSTKDNCEVKNGELTGGVLDPDKDGYYYIVSTCARCGEQKTLEKHVFYYADMTQGSKYYVAGDGVVGFVVNSSDTPQARIKESEFTGDNCVVLENCELGGIYYLYTLNQDGTLAAKQTFTKSAAHSWSQIYFAVNNDIINSKGISSKTKIPGGITSLGDIASLSRQELFATVKPGSKELKLGKDDDGLPTLSGVNCSTTGEYELVRYCLICKKIDDSILGKRKATKGDHVYSLEFGKYRVTDYTKTKYNQVKDKDGNVDKEHHLEHYFDNVVCTICGAKDTVDSLKPDALVDHIFTPQFVESTRIEPTCGVDGSVERVATCACLLTDESTKTTVTIPKTDDHDFGENKVCLEWSGDVYIKKNGSESSHNITVRVGRKCNVCEAFDGNGINTEGISGKVEGLAIRPDTFTVTKTRDAKIDPATGIAYRCSTALATVEVNWVGTVDGELVRLNKDNYDEAVRENVPYYSDLAEYQARTAHTPGKPQKEGDRIITYCTVCGDIVSDDPDNTPDVGVPTVSAASVDYDTVNVSWTKVDGATAYRLYFRSSDEGISKWQRIRTFTSDATSYQVNGLTTGSKYRFTVRAEITSDGETTLGDYSKTGAVAVPKLTAPEIKSVTASGKTTKVTWSRVDGASGYIVFRNSQRVGTVTKGSKVTWTDKKPVSGAKYQIRAYRTEDKKNYKSDLSEVK